MRRPPPAVGIRVDLAPALHEPARRRHGPQHVPVAALDGPPGEIPHHPREPVVIMIINIIMTTFTAAVAAAAAAVIPAVASDRQLFAPELAPLLVKSWSNPGQILVESLVKSSRIPAQSW